MNEEIKHTPAPWSVSIISGGIGDNGGIAIDAKDPDYGEIFEVAEVWGIDRDTVHDERSRANANLISYAPALLEALENVLKCGRGTSGRIIIDEDDEADIIAAIASAKGKGE